MSRATNIKTLVAALGLTMANMTPAEHVAQRTWSTLGRAKRLRARFGEETLTDLLVLDMLPHRLARGFWLLPTTKKAEASCGADLFVAVRYRMGRWTRFAVQAKKLYPNGEYRTLDGGRKCADQLDKLEQFAQQLSALPLYLLYNHSSTVQPSKHWHCPQPFEEEQLGCTLVPSWHIRRMICSPRPRDFDLAHKINQSLPWRCAFDCPYAEALLFQMTFSRRHCNPNEPSDREAPGTRQYDWSFEPLQAAWPEWLFHASMTQLTVEDIDRIRRELTEVNRSHSRDTLRETTRSDYDGSPLYPARLLIVDQLEEPTDRPLEPRTL